MQKEVISFSYIETKNRITTYEVFAQSIFTRDILEIDRNKGQFRFLGFFRELMPEEKRKIYDTIYSLNQDHGNFTIEIQPKNYEYGDHISHYYGRTREVEFDLRNPQDPVVYVTFFDGNTTIIHPKGIFWDEKSDHNTEYNCVTAANEWFGSHSPIDESKLIIRIIFPKKKKKGLFGW